MAVDARFKIAGLIDIVRLTIDSNRNSCRPETTAVNGRWVAGRAGAVHRAAERVG